MFLLEIVVRVERQLQIGLLKILKKKFKNMAFLRLATPFVIVSYLCISFFDFDVRFVTRENYSTISYKLSRIRMRTHRCRIVCCGEREGGGGRAGLKYRGSSLGGPRYVSSRKGSEGLALSGAESSHGALNFSRRPRV